MELYEVTPALIATAAPDEITLTHDQAKELLQALLGSQTFMTRRDQMNAAVHCSEVRWSPLTEQVHKALNMFNAVLIEQYKADVT